MALEAPPIADWNALAASKREASMKKIPSAWELSSSLTSQFLPTSTLNVLDVPRTCGLLSERELQLTENYDATALIELMTTGQVKSLDVVKAFCKRAAIAQQCVSCLTEIMFEEAVARARECDEFLEREGRPIGPLHGLPVSLKDSFNVKGVQATIGYVSLITKPPSATNSAIVQILYDAGAVFYCKTNLPQTMMTADSHNNIFGRTLNPSNLSLTAGGSTGGEGALLKMRGSVLGVTTDVAGSTRIPAVCSGITSFKPTAGRVPFAGNVPPGRLGGPSPILPVIGPMTHSVRDCDLFLKTVLETRPWLVDENVLNVPWRRVQPSQSKLRFGLIRGHPKRPLHPPVARTLHSTAEKLKEYGHEIVLLDDKIPDLWESAILAWKFFMLDPKKTPFQYVNNSGEPLIPSIATAVFPELKGWQASLDELWDMNVQRAKILRGYHDLYIGEKLDAVLTVGYNATAVPHDTYGVPPYTVLQNLINYPAGILPVSKAEEKLDQPFFNKDTAYEPPYDPKTFEGAPTTIQIMGKPMEDEECLKIMEVVESIIAKPS